MTDTIPERVARGAALLDKKLPGWDKRIDVARLDVGSPCNCVVGQEFDGRVPRTLPLEPFNTGIRILLGEIVDADQVAPYGFDLYSNEPQDEAYDALTAEWTRVIEERRGGEGDA